MLCFHFRYVFSANPGGVSITQNVEAVKDLTLILSIVNDMFAAAHCSCCNIAVGLQEILTNTATQELKPALSSKRIPGFMPPVLVFGGPTVICIQVLTTGKRVTNLFQLVSTNRSLSLFSSDSLLQRIDP